MKTKALFLAVLMVVSMALLRWLLQRDADHDSRSHHDRRRQRRRIPCDRRGFFEKAIGADGTWIISTTADLTVTKALTLDGEFTNGKKDDAGKDIIQRKIGLYTQDADRKVTARFNLTIPEPPSEPQSQHPARYRQRRSGRGCGRLPAGRHQSGRQCLLHPAVLQGFLWMDADSSDHRQEQVKSN
jgi:hypothetical protein